MSNDVVIAAIGVAGALFAALVPLLGRSAVAKNTEAIKECLAVRDAMPKDSPEQKIMSEALIYLAVRQETLSAQWRLNGWVATIFMGGFSLSLAAFLVGETGLGWVIALVFMLLTSTSGSWATPKTLRSHRRLD